MQNTSYIEGWRLLRATGTTSYTTDTMVQKKQQLKKLKKGQRVKHTFDSLDTFGNRLAEM